MNELKRPVNTDNKNDRIKKTKLDHPGFDLTFKHPSNFLLCGPSSSGKTHLALKIIKNKRILFDVVPKHVILIYSYPQKVYQEMYALGVITNMLEGYSNFEEIQVGSVNRIEIFRVYCNINLYINLLY